MGTIGANGVPPSSFCGHDPAIVVVRDREPAALCHPPPDLFRGFGPVRYHHISHPDPLPAASHYVFNCDEFSPRVRELLSHIERARSVTVIVGRVDDWILPRLTGSHVNLLPAYGEADHISPKTLARALRMILSGGRVVARGFIQNSLETSPRLPAGGLHPFLRMIQEASAAANAEVPTVAGVLALQRTGSKYLKDLMGMTISGRVRVFHEHDLPARGDPPDTRRPLFDQLVLESDIDRRSSLRSGILSEALQRPRRYLFVTERDPAERLLSYFAKRHSAWLAARFDHVFDHFQRPEEIRAAFDEWCVHQVRRQRHWYTRMLARPFGLDVLGTVPIDGGVLFGRRGSNALMVIPLSRFESIRRAVAGTFGEDSCRPLNDNSARSRGDQRMYDAFRRDFAVDPAMLAEVWSIPEVQHIHGPRPT
jgi:hypothetical protein